jgi:4-diphosphocytidyl-2-C-methyl-D-erythritol kinase
MVFAEVGDRLTVRPSETLTLEITGRYAHTLAAEPPEKNLVMKAARHLQLLAGVDSGAHIHLEKNLPVGGGIGGGSTDAAAALKSLCRLWKLTLPQEVLHALALSLGADVPVCLNASATLVRGIGESLTPFPIPALHALLVNPGIHISTRDIFSRTTGGFRTSLQPTPVAPASHSELLSLLRATHNDLEPIASGIAPEINTVIEALHAEAGCSIARMSGSGSTCFGLFETAAQATQAATHLSQNKTAWWIQATRLF